VPHRTAAYSELCHECGARTDASCVRCGLPLCDAHLPADDQRCSGCERGYQLTRQGDRNAVSGRVFAGVGVVAVLSVVAVIVGMLVGVSLGTTGVAATVALLVGTAGGTWFATAASKRRFRSRERAAREAFLEQRPQHLLSGRTDAPEDG